MVITMKATLTALICAITLVMVCLGGAFFLTLFISPVLVSGRPVGLSWSQTQADYWRIIGYLTLPRINGPLHLHWFPVDERVERHFKDVRRLVQWGLVATLGFTGVAGVSLFRLLKNWQAWRLLWVLPRLMLFLLVVLVMIALNFNDAFLWFHRHAFTNLDWVFRPQKEPLIKLWPTTFFFSLLLMWGSLTEGLLWLVSYWLKGRLGLLLHSTADKTDHCRN